MVLNYVLGRTEEFNSPLCKAMIAHQVSVLYYYRGGRGLGLGPAPLEFSDSVGLPLEPLIIL